MNNFYFPSWWNIHDGRLSGAGTDLTRTSSNIASGRALFGDFGRIGCLAVTDHLQICAQFNKEAPLAYDGFQCYYNKCEEAKEENHNVNPYHFISERKSKLRTLNYISNNIERIRTPLKRKHKSQMEEIISLVEDENFSMNKVRNKLAFVPPFLQHFASKRFDLISPKSLETALQMSCPIYSGGCIKTVRFSGNTFIVHCDGPCLSKLTIKRFDTETDSLQKTTIEKIDLSPNIDDPILQIDTADFSHFSIIVVRLLSSIVLLRLSRSEKDELVVEPVSVPLSSIEPFVSCKQNRDFHNDLIVTHNDKLIVMETERMENVWQKDLTNYSTVIDQWNELHTCSVPKSILVTNRSNCQLIDYRINPFQSAKELYNSCVDSLSQSETFWHATSPIDDYRFYMFSTFNSLLIDIRSPGIAVSQWTTPSTSPISFSSIAPTPFSNGDRVDVVAGCQLDGKHFVFQHDLEHHSKSSSISSRFHGCHGHSDGDIMSLGLEAVWNERFNRLSVLTIDHQGNTVAHRYVSVDGGHNGTAASIDLEDLADPSAAKCSRPREQLRSESSQFDEDKEEDAREEDLYVEDGYDFMGRFFGVDKSVMDILI